MCKLLASKGFKKKEGGGGGGLVVNEIRELTSQLKSETSQQ